MYIIDIYDYDFKMVNIMVNKNKLLLLKHFGLRNRYSTLILWEELIAVQQ